MKHKKIFAPKGRNPGQSSKVKHSIDTEIHFPINKKLRRTEAQEEKVIRKEVEGMMKERIIRKSKSEWAAPVLLVEKPNKRV